MSQTHVEIFIVDQILGRNTLTYCREHRGFVRKQTVADVVQPRLRILWEIDASTPRARPDAHRVW
jgi:hypothetical protein